MSNFLKIFLLATLLQYNGVYSRRIIKKIWIHKEFEHGGLHHFIPLSIIKEAITPFGKFSFEHTIEKGEHHIAEHHVEEHHEEGHVRKKREADDSIHLPDEFGKELNTVVEMKKEITNQNNLLTDIIFTRVEFHKGTPVDAIKFHSVLFPSDSESSEIKKQETITSSVSETSPDLEAQESLKEDVVEAAPVPLSVPEENKPLETAGEAVDLQSEKNIEAKPEEIISELSEKQEQNEKIIEAKPDEIVNELPGKDENIENNEFESGSLPVDAIAIKDETPEVKPSETAVVDEAQNIENRETEVELSEAVNKDVEIVDPSKLEQLNIKSGVVVTPIIPIESSPLPVSPVPVPVYIPIYTNVRPAPVPVETPVVPEVVNTPPPVVVVTEKEIVVANPPPPPPVETETTVIESPGLFSRGSRFMLNIGSRILKKLLRIVSRVQARLPAQPEEGH